ncbi:MAG TPA: DMT family protein [Phycisphaerales bacterium]|nr:DMT family protein [Phycisphaerales bacterium]
MGKALLTVLLLVASNVFMTFAWYGHLKARSWTLFTAIAVSWLIALPEYVLQVPANRIGHAGMGGPFTAPQLKILQEAITLTVFTVFVLAFLKERPRINDYVAFGLIMLAVVVAMWGKGGPLVNANEAPERAASVSERSSAPGAEAH